MKIIIKKIFITALILTGFISSCTDEIMDEIDTNPNSPLEVPIALLMPQVTVTAAFGVAGTVCKWKLNAII